MKLVHRRRSRTLHDSSVRSSPRTGEPAVRSSRGEGGLFLLKGCAGCGGAGTRMHFLRRTSNSVLHPKEALWFLFSLRLYGFNS